MGKRNLLRLGSRSTKPDTFTSISDPEAKAKSSVKIGGQVMAVASIQRKRKKQKINWCEVAEKLKSDLGLAIEIEATIKEWLTRLASGTLNNLLYSFLRRFYVWLVMHVWCSWLISLFQTFNQLHRC